MSVLNALSVDVEEYYHGVEFEAAVALEDRPLLPSRVAASTDRALALLAGVGVRATFFVLGCVTRSHPDVVRRIAAAGHEVACHGDSHQLVSRQTPETFAADVRAARDSLEQTIGEPVIGYRAPNYSITEAQTWAFDVLLEEGFRYDSSVYPIHHDRYGFPGAPRSPYVVRRQRDEMLWEFPLATVRIAGVNLPIGGGGLFRLLPADWFRRGYQRLNRREQRPGMFYFHPWELDPDQPRVPMPASHRFRHYVNLHRTEAKLGRFLRAVPFAPARDVLARAGAFPESRSTEHAG